MPKASNDNFNTSAPAKRRVNYGNGSYADIVQNQDGSTTTTTYTPCKICGGAKTCSICYGAGGRYSGFGNYQVYNLCSSCGGDGKCRFCMGSGMTVFISTYYPSSGQTVGKDLWSGKTYFSGDNNGSTHHHSSSNSSSEKCSICHGTGVDPFAWETPGSLQLNGLKGCYTNSRGSECPYCNKYTWHQHARCPCNQ